MSRVGLEWYKREPLAYLGDVQGMTAREHAVYSVVLDLIYLHGGSVNNDPGWISGWIKDMGTAAVRNTIKGLMERGTLTLDGDQITQKRARNEAKTKQKHRETAAENGKKGGEKSAKIRAARKENKGLEEPNASSEIQPEKRREEKRREGGGDDARAREAIPDRTDREIILSEIGADPISGLVGPNGAQIGRMADMQEYQRWKSDLGLTRDEVVVVIREVMARKPDGPPSTFTYFRQAMQRYAGAKNKPTLTPIEGGANERHHDNRRGGPATAAGRAHDGLIAAFARTIPIEQGGGGFDP